MDMHYYLAGIWLWFSLAPSYKWQDYVDVSVEQLPILDLRYVGQATLLLLLFYTQRGSAWPSSHLMLNDDKAEGGSALHPESSSLRNWLSYL